MAQERDAMGIQHKGAEITPFLGRRVPYPLDRTVPALIEERVKAAPESIAVSHGARSLTYGELDRRANALAGQLLELGVSRGELVPFLVEGGLEVPVAMLAVWKLAAAFTPIDPGWPAERVGALLEMMAPKAVLCSPRCADPSRPQRELVVDALEPAGRPSDPLPPPAGLDDLSYGFFTSGSTGLPKCALNLHRGLLNRFLYMSGRFGSRAEEVVLQNSRHTFDSSLWQLLWPLTGGGRVVVPERSGFLDFGSTVEEIRLHRVTMTDFTPSVFNVLVELLATRPELVCSLTSLRHVLVGGEEISPGAVRKFRAMLPEVAVVNTYGPTEASIGSIFHEVTDEDVDIPIGRPIENTYAVVVDDRMRPAGTGEVGEICIGGDCLGAGYLADPDRTSAVFVANPFPQIPGTRLYRTGDLGQLRDDGNLYFLGRRDLQVKIGGVRVEPAEIESALRTHPDVREARVIAIERAGAKLLVAFVLGAAGLTPGSVAAHAREKLPAGLIPGRFVVLDRFPMLPTGKTDRRALMEIAARPDMSHASGVSSQDGCPDEVERAVRSIWTALLPIGKARADSHFFNSGGDSLTAHRLALALAERFGMELTVHDVMAAPLLSDQVARLRGARSTGERNDEDFLLPEDLSYPDHRLLGPVENIFLTGATGFLGAHILSELLARTSAHMHCLVRASDRGSARQRLEDALSRFRLGTHEDLRRITPVPGDVSLPRLGLGPAEFSRLAARVDTVVHAAALVNLVLPYSSHRSANVVGTLETLRFAAAGRGKAVHFLSTLGVLPAHAGHGVWAEQPPLASVIPTDGYSRSKWVAERLLEQASGRGLAVAIHRFGEVMPHSLHGVPHQRGLADLIIRACVRLGLCFPSPIVMDYTPADHASAFVTAAVVGRKRGIYHVLGPSPVPFDRLLGVFGRELGLRQVPYREFWHALADACARRPDDRALGGVLAVLPGVDGVASPGDGAGLALLFGDLTGRYRNDRAEGLLAGGRMAWPGVDGDLLKRYAAYYRTRDPESERLREPSSPSSAGKQR